MANNIPTQIRTIDSFSSYNSNVVNRLTRIITNDVNCISTADPIEVTIDSTSSVIVSTGRCFKDDVMIEITDPFTVDLELSDFYNGNPFNEVGIYYLTLNYSYVKAKPAPQAEILILKPSQTDTFNTESLLLLKCIKVVFDGEIFSIDSITDSDPNDINIHRIYTDTFCGMYDSLYTYTYNTEHAKIIYVRDQDDLFWGGRDNWRKIGELQYIFDTSECVVGNLAYISTDSKIYPSIATDLSTFAECIVVGDNKIQINGECSVKIESGIIVNKGEKIYLSYTEAGSATNVEPTTAQLIGIATSDGTSTCTVLINSLGKIQTNIDNSVTSNENNIKQLATDLFGTSYILNEQGGGSSRFIGSLENYKATQNLMTYRTWYSPNSGATITNFLDCNQDDIKYIIFINDLTTIVNNSKIQLSGGENLTGSTGKILTLMYDNGVWREVSYSSESRSLIPSKLTSIVSGSDWIESTTSDSYSINISEFGDKNVIINCYDESNKKIFPKNNMLYSNNECILIMPTDTTGIIKVVISLASINETIQPSNWILSGESYYYDINSQFIDTTGAIVICYEETTLKQIIPMNVEILDEDTIRIWMPINTVKMLVLIDFADLVSEINAGQPYSPVYPPSHTGTYVKSTTYYSSGFHPYYATDPTKSLTGAGEGNSWVSQDLEPDQQRFHIDLGSSKIITRIYYENGHESGASTNQGAKTFTVWGSNDAGSFADTDYFTDVGWTGISASQETFEQHVALDIADPKYIFLENSNAYRYYAIKISDNWGNTSYMSLRHIELQEDDSESGDWTISGSQYYYDLDISSIDSTAMITFFYDTINRYSVSPTNVEILNVNTLRIWMNEPIGLSCLIDSLNNIVEDLELSIQSSFLSYYGLIDTSNIDSEDVVVSCFDNITNRIRPFNSDLSIEVLNSKHLKVWSTSNSISIRIVVIG